jgi:elongation factor Ts
VTGFFKQVVLLDQPSVQDQKRSVQQVLADSGVTLTRFARFEVGEA